MRKIITFWGLITIILSNSIVIFGEEVRPKIKLIYGKWGDKPGEFGIKLDEDGDIEGIEGPNDFYVDEEGFIYILDNVNERVQIFDSQGGFVRIDKEMYEKVKKKGNTRIHTFPDGSKIEVSTGLLLKEREEIFPNEKKYKIERKKEIKDGKTIFSTIISLPSNEEITFSSEKGYSMWGEIEGVDRFGNIYISFNPKDLIYEIFKCSLDGQKIGFIRIYAPSSYHWISGGAGGFIRVFSTGDIYTMNSDHTGFWIDCYPTELFDKPEGRDFTHIYSKKGITEKERDEKTKQLAVSLAKTTKGKMRDSAIAFLGRQKVIEAIPLFESYLQEEAKDKTIVDLQRKCLGALRDIGTERAINLIEKYGLENKDLETKIMACKLLINTKLEKKAIETIKDIVRQGDINYGIAREILNIGETLKYEGKKEAIDIWIELLKVPWTIGDEARECLEEITGKNFGNRPSIKDKKVLEEYIKKWRDWWEKNKDSFEFPK